MDPIVQGKLLSNRYILGMTEFSLGIIFNITTFFVLITTGIVKQSAGFYLLFLSLADLLYLVCSVLMEEFYNPLIGLDVFDESGEGVLLCQVVLFFREMTLFWRWFLMVMLVIDRCLLAGGVLEMPRLRILAVILTLVGMGVSAGLAGYWIYWVDNDLYPQGFAAGTCRFALAPPDDKSSEWFLMVSIVHILYPDGLLFLSLIITAIILLCRLKGKAAESLEGDDYSLCKAVAGLAFINILINIPYIVVNCIIMYVDRIWDVYDFSAEIQTNLSYTAIITSKFKDFNMCITFFILLFASQFRSAFCKN